MISNYEIRANILQELQLILNYLVLSVVDLIQKVWGGGFIYSYEETKKTDGKLNKLNKTHFIITKEANVL